MAERLGGGGLSGVAEAVRPLPIERLVDGLPEGLRAPAVLDLAWWQVGALPVLAITAAVVGLALGRACRGVLVRLTRHTSGAWDDTIARRARGPLALTCGVAVFALGAPALALEGRPAHHVGLALKTILFVAMFWALSRSIDVIGDVIARSPWTASRPHVRGMVPLGTRVAKVAIVVMAAIAVLATLGYPVARLIAGLGIGGLAMALAAQKTVENLFGAFSLAADQPFREGDFVRIEDTVGTVEEIGLRSTRLRTLDRTLVTYPNGQLADMRLESFAVRDRMRLACILRLDRGAKASQIREVLEGVEAVLRGHEKIWPDAVVVRFQQIGEWSHDIEVMAWFVTDWGGFQLSRQEVLLQILEVIEKAGTRLAVPARTLSIAAQEEGPASTKPAA